MPRFPDAAKVPHTLKRPERCPYCESRTVARKGVRKKKLEVVQLWRCGSCKRVFTPTPAAMRNKTYPLRVVLDALSTYNQGYSLEETAKRTRSKTNHHVAPSTIAAWLLEYRGLTSYRRLRAGGLRRFKPEHAIRSIKLYHRQVYGYSYHRSKLAMLREGKLDDKRMGDTRFAPVADFLETIPTTCPHELFHNEREGARASQAVPTWANTSRLIVNRKENAATRAAALIIPSIGDNKRRHESLQKFMLANDSVTVAVEVPIWLSEHDIVALEKRHGIGLIPQSGGARTVTGHIDFVQVRNGGVHLLDYKPDARTNKPIAQLAIYALALTRLVPGLKLFDIKCAWFNEEEYCEFFPRTLFVRQ